MAPAPAPARGVVQDFPPEYQEDAQSRATMEMARALHRLADVGAALKPAAETVHGLGERLDKLCAWLTSSKPWKLLVLALVLIQTISRAPEEAPKLIDALSKFVGALT